MYLHVIYIEDMRTKEVNECAVRVLSRKIIWGGKLVLRAVLVAPGGGCRKGVCPLPREARKLSPF